MKELSFEKMEEVNGGDKGYSDELCGVGVAVLIFATGGWALLGAGIALTFCLSGDTQQ